jgi:hypothetical protein
MRFWEWHICGRCGLEFDATFVWKDSSKRMSLHRICPRGECQSRLVLARYVEWEGQIQVIEEVQ